LLEKIPLAGIARVTEVSEPWLQQGDCTSCLRSSVLHLQSYVNAKYEAVPKKVEIKEKKKGD
jgi:hypothetical protein